MGVQNGKKPVSNLSSALANIHLSNSGSSPNSQYSQQPQNEDLIQNQQRFGFNANNNNNNSQHQINNINTDQNLNRNHNFNDCDPRFINSGNIQNQNLHNPQQQNQENATRAPYYIPSADVNMSQVPEDFPLDRIGLYRKNLPTEGISLFSHRVSNFKFFCFVFVFLNVIHHII